MIKRGSLVFAAAVAASAIGLFALRFPVFIDAYDQFGWQVKCGSGFTTDLAQASGADSKRNDHRMDRADVPSDINYAGQCDKALRIRRAWAISAAAVGGLTLVWLAAVTLAHDRRNIRS